MPEPSELEQLRQALDAALARARTLQGIVDRQYELLQSLYDTAERAHAATAESCRYGHTYAPAPISRDPDAPTVGECERCGAIYTPEPEEDHDG